MINSYSLAGTWNCALDTNEEGIEQEWYRQSLADQINLPGTLDENSLGEKNEETNLIHLSRKHTFTGRTWYSREVELPPQWQNKYIQLFLERTKCSQVWFDGQWIGSDESLCTPHVFPLGKVTTPGRHRLTIMVDNGKNLAITRSHQVEDQTQTNWNGILGKIYLKAHDAVWLKDIQASVTPKQNKAIIKVNISNHTQDVVKGELELKAECLDCSTGDVAAIRFPYTAQPGETYQTLEYPLGDSLHLWNEWSPNMYRLSVKLTSNQECYSDCHQVDFGLRNFRVSGTQFEINQCTTFLRGKVDCCVFPLTGYAPMTTEEWVRIFTIAKSYGINHYRFHSWCPPEAAFAAADQVGIYLQPELPNKTSFVDSEHKAYKPHHLAYMRNEGERILKAYGHHPSFVMFALGNELWEHRHVMQDVVAHFRSFDPNRLYCEGSNNFGNQPSLNPGDDYWITAKTREQGGQVRGSTAHCDLPLGHIQIKSPSTLEDFQTGIEGIPVPVIGHENGQYQVYPDFSEIEKYTGVLEPRNLAVFRERLQVAGMLDQANDFQRASGSLAILCYREDIESALRTPGFAGFQLLDLQDFPGQGTALVGILDAFMDSKGLIEPAVWREFCSPVVILLRMDKYTYMNSESIKGEIEVANYGSSKLTQAELNWSLATPDDQIIASGKTPLKDIEQGQLSHVGHIEIELDKIQTAQKLTLRAYLAGTEVKTRYSVWVYPQEAELASANDVSICTSYDEQAQTKLAQGGKVLLLIDPKEHKQCIPGFFTPDFWCYPMFERACLRQNKQPAPGTMGLLCDPNHPLFKHFPTEYHTNWQWWDIIMNSGSLILDKTPEAFRPLVQVIDNVHRNHKLGLVMEARVDSGKLLICCCDLTKHRESSVVIRQFYHSVLAYMSSDEFQPDNVLSQADLSSVLTDL